MARGRSTKRYCSPRCRKAASRDAVGAVSVTGVPPPILSVTSAPAPPRRAPDAPVAPSLGFGKVGDPPLQGDDYPIEMDSDGYPVMPDCLVRRDGVDHA